MDTSKQYISMCLSADEIQVIKHTEDHDIGEFVFHDGRVKIVNGYSLNEFVNEFRTVFNIDDDFTEQWHSERISPNIQWLPRQDQLQRLYFKKASEYGNDYTKMNFTINYEYLNNVEIFYIECETINIDSEMLKINSFEQYWLCIYMHFVCNKRWDGEKWNLIN